MKFFYFVCGSTFIALVLITLSLRSESTSFIGIADAKEMVINAETAVEVKDIFIVPGQQVASGDTLVELRSPELDMKRSQLRIDYETRMTEIVSELQQLESQCKINRQLVRKLRSISAEDLEVADNSDNPASIRIRNLKLELARLKKLTAIMDDNLHNHVSFTAAPNQSVQVEDPATSPDSPRLHSDRPNRLFIIAPCSGVIGTVYYKKGQMVDSFDSIATLHAEYPSFVQGYIPENRYSTVAIGQRVRVRSTADRTREVFGDVIGVGSRIVEYPIRLRKAPEILMWGREVTVRIPEKNSFLLGEKVMIDIVDSRENKPMHGLSRLLPSTAYASPLAADAAQTTPEFPPLQDIRTTPDAPIEASGAVYLPELRRYCLISDESDRLFLMDSSGRITRDVPIKGLPSIDDLEGICQDSRGNIYLTSSQNPTKKGKLPSNRRLLVRLKRSGESFEVTGEVRLLDLLIDAAKPEPTAAWTRLIRIDEEERSPDIEGIAWQDSSLFLSFKNPLLEGRSAIICIKNIDAVFAHHTLSSSAVELWRQLPLTDAKTGIVYHISDMQFVGADLYVLGCGTVPRRSRQTPAGRLWALRAADGRLDLVRDFGESKPEGLAWDAQSRAMFITFDNGAHRSSQMTIIKGMQP
jgi:HlyD family secretion protein